VVYVGEQAGSDHLKAAGLAIRPYAGKLAAHQVLVVGPGGGQELAPDAAAIAAWLKDGGRLLSIGLDEREARAFLPFHVRMKEAEHISAWFEPFGMQSPLAGVGPAEVHNRDPRTLPLIVDGVTVSGNGVLAQSEYCAVVFGQLVPRQFADTGNSITARHSDGRQFLVTRLLADIGAAGDTPLERFSDRGRRRISQALARRVILRPA
jgi:hypothetical protein